MNDRRVFFTADARFAVVAASNGKPAMLTGYALVWNVLSTDRGGYKVRLAPNSAKFVTPTLALFHHDYRAVIGNTDNGTLRIKSDDIGAAVEIDLPDTSAGRDTAELVNKKYVRGMSFAMVDTPQGVTTTENGVSILDAQSFEVDEVSITPIPSFTQANISVKNEAPPAAGYANRIAQANRLNVFSLDRVRLFPGAEIPRTQRQ